MFRYIHKGKEHNETGREYMLSLGMDTDAIESVLAQKEYEENQNWAVARKKRDALIASTDYTQVSDSPFPTEKQTEFQAYRKALRDIPQTFSYPNDIVWPVKPG